MFEGLGKKVVAKKNEFLETPKAKGLMTAEQAGQSDDRERMLNELSDNEAGIKVTDFLFEEFKSTQYDTGAYRRLGSLRSKKMRVTGVFDGKKIQATFVTDSVRSTRHGPLSRWVDISAIVDGEKVSDTEAEAVLEWIKPVILKGYSIEVEEDTL